jgi:hypothetical protein
LTEKLDKYGLSTADVNKLVKLVVNAKRYGFDAKKFVGKLSNIKEIEKREKGLRGNCVIFSKQVAKYREIFPLAQIIYDLHIDRSELISFKVAVNEAAQKTTCPICKGSGKLPVTQQLMAESYQNEIKYSEKK